MPSICGDVPCPAQKKIIFRTLVADLGTKVKKKPVGIQKEGQRDEGRKMRKHFMLGSSLFSRAQRNGSPQPNPGTGLRTVGN